MKIKKTICLCLLLALCPALSGCRARTTAARNPENDPVVQTEDTPNLSADGSLPDHCAEQSPVEDIQKKNEEAGGQTKENPESSRKEYDETAPAEIVPGTDRSLHHEGEGSGAPVSDETAAETADQQNDGAEDTATQTVAAQEADEMGVSEDAEEADSAMTFYTVLLQDRLGSLFECKRLNLYWETAEDHVTVHKTSPEHGMILDAGAYDVSARLLPENLRVDDGWIGRKNPGVIVKAVSGSVLGSGTVSTAAARRIYTELLSREGWAAIDAVRNNRVILLSEELLQAPYLKTAAALMIARVAYPDLFPDIDTDKALNMLAEEATGSMPAGIFYYDQQGGIR